MTDPIDLHTRFFLILILFVLALVPLSDVVAEDQKGSYEPGKHLLEDLKKKGISIEKWRFCEAVRRGDFEQVSKSLSDGADPNGICNTFVASDMPVIFLALLSNANKEVISALVKKGANVNSRYTPAKGKYVVDDNRFLALVQRFFFNKLEASQNADYFPLYYAARYTSPEIVELLIQLGADITLRTSVNETTALFGVTEIEIAKALLRNGANINDRDVNGRTVLRKIKQDTLNHLSERHHLRPKIEAYVAWLISQGAHE